MAANLIKCAYLPGLILLLAVSGAVHAEAMSDPTRPLFGSVEGSAAGNANYEPVVRGLSSVMIAKEKCAAIIDGKTIMLGGRYGAEKLVEVNERGVVLQGASGRRTMTLFPAVGIKVAAEGGKRNQVKCGTMKNSEETGQSGQDDQKEKK